MRSSRTGTRSRSNSMPSPPLPAISTADDVADQVPRLRVLRAAEAQGIEQRDRPRSHREHVAQDAADAGRGALIRLDKGRVVVALDLEHDGVAVADIDDSGVLAGAADH